MDYSFLDDVDRKVVELSGYGAARGFGSRPALLLIDVQNKFIGPDRPILDVAAAHPLAIGENAHRAIEQIARLLSAARSAHIPVFYTVNILTPNETVFNSFAKKRPPYERTGRIDADGESIYRPLKPLETEWVIHKRYASAFFGTPLTSFLNALDCDTLLIGGFSTSGCIRACCVDAASYNLHAVVAEDGVADRIASSHRSALLDINLKYGDVLPTDSILSYMTQYSHHSE